MRILSDNFDGPGIEHWDSITAQNNEPQDAMQKSLISLQLMGSSIVTPLVPRSWMLVTVPAEIDCIYPEILLSGVDKYMLLNRNSTLLIKMMITQ